MKEIWKKIPDYKDYRVSNYGRVKSLKRIKERILKPGLNMGYHAVVLSNYKDPKTFKVHQLVAVSFLNHVINGNTIIVHHLDNNPLNNRLDNLELRSQRENCFTHHEGTSKFRGVSWCNYYEKWNARIWKKPKYKNLGYFTDENKAIEAYQVELKKIKLC